MKTSRRQVKRISEPIKKQTVKDIENGRGNVTEASRELGVSTQTIYNWLERFSRYLKKGKILVVEEESKAYRTKELERHNLELEAAVGRKQMEVDLLEKIIELAGESYDCDLKKSFSKEHLNGSVSTKGKNTGTK